MMQKYRALRIVSTIYRLLAVAVGGLGVAAGIYTAITPSISFEYIGNSLEMIQGPPAVGSGIGIVFGAILAAVGLFAFAELLQLLMDIEENTRVTSQYFKRRAQPEVSDEPARQGSLVRKRSLNP
jgi:TRAP-type C4-dicarboxylate transport system permease small subunit